MAVYEFPAEVLRDLLLNIDGEISSACPYAFLLTDGGEAPLEPHRAWLKKHKLLDTPPEQDGRMALLPSLRRALDIVARPVRRIVVAEAGPEATHRSVHVSDGIEAVVAMFDEQHCQLSDPLDLKSFRAGLVKIVGAARAKSAPKPIQLHPAVLQLLGVMLALSPENGSSKGEAQQSETGLRLSRQACAERLGAWMENPSQGEELLEQLLADKVLQSINGSVEIHPAFEPWHAAITSGHILEIQRLEFPDSRLENAQPLVRGYFLGEAGNRCLMWPAGDNSGEILLSRPTAKELQSFVGYLIGYADPE